MSGDYKARLSVLARNSQSGLRPLEAWMHGHLLEIEDGWVLHIQSWTDNRLLTQHRK